MSADNETTTPWDKSVMKLNSPLFVIRRNIRNNIRRQLPQIEACPENSAQIAIVGGGWSLNDPAVFEELRQLYFDGVKLVALNGSARWLMERNLRPSVHVMLDSRPENAEFVRDAIPHCRYLLASQAAPEVFDACEGREVNIFHAIGAGDVTERRRLDDFYDKRWIAIPPAGTVGVVSTMLFRILGFRYQHLFGVDSCYPHDGSANHHAYPQALNDGEGAAVFRYGGRDFRCSAWQASQAQTMLEVIQENGHLFDLEIHGDGLIAHMLRTRAAEQDIETGAKG